MKIALRRAEPADLIWVEVVTLGCPVAMAEFGGFYSRASTSLSLLLGEDRELLIIWRGEIRIGFLDVDRTDATTLGLAYFVSPSHRRKGVASAALLWLAEQHPDCTLQLAVDPGNGASLAVARRTGFVDTGANTFGDRILMREPHASVAPQ